MLQRLVRLRARAGRREVRRARHPGRRGRVRALHHVRDERRADRGDGAAPAHARDARRDAGVGRAAPDRRHHRRPALPRLVAARAPADALVPRRADRRPAARCIGAVYLTEKEDGSMFSAADQKLIELLAAHAAIAIENARLHERSRELSIIEERNRLARELHDSRHAAAVRRRAGGRVRRRRCSSATASKAAAELRARERARARRDGGAARGGLRAAARVAGGRRAWRPCCASTSRCCGACPAQQIELRGVRRAAAARPGRRRRCCGSPRRRSATRCATRRPSGSRCKLGGDDGTLFLKVADDGCGFDPAGPEVRGQRLGLTSMEERATELGGTLTRDLDARRTARPSGWRSPRDPRPARRRPRRRAPGPAHVPRPPGRHRGRRRGGRRRGRAWTPPRAPTRT